MWEDFPQDMLFLLTLQIMCLWLSVTHHLQQTSRQHFCTWIYFSKDVSCHGCAFSRAQIGGYLTCPGTTHHQNLILRTQLLTTAFKYLPRWFWGLFLHSQNRSLIICLSLYITVNWPSSLLFISALNRLLNWCLKPPSFGLRHRPTFLLGMLVLPPI